MGVVSLFVSRLLPIKGSVHATIQRVLVRNTFACYLKLENLMLMLQQAGFILGFKNDKKKGIFCTSRERKFCSTLHIMS
jgi:hypothetical protein